MKHIDLIELSKIAKKYRFDNIFEFPEWVEDNNLGEILFEKDIEEIEQNKEEIDKDGLKYKSTILALDILILPDIKELETDLDKITSDQWLELSRKAKNNREEK